MFINGNVIRSENNNLVALESKLGWILSGTHETGERISNTHIYRVDCFSQKPEPINNVLNNFLKTESSEFLNTGSDCVKIFKKNLILMVVDMKLSYHSDRILILYPIIMQWQKNV